MNMLNGGQLFAKALKKEGADCVFTLPGGHIMPILYGCREEGIRVVDTRHECSGGYAADSYAKVSGKPGILITTAGPGVTNATTAMAEAAETGTPLIHIGGASPRIENDTGSLQDVRSFEAMSTFCKWSKKIHNAQRIPEYVSMAYRHALSGTPGPVYLEIAVDVLLGTFEEDTIYWPSDTRANSEPFGDPAMIEKAAEALINAKRPAMVIGDPARYYSQYGESVEALANYLQMPVFSCTVSRGLFADESKNELFRIGTGALATADVVLELCVDRSYKVGKGRPPRFHKEALRIVAHPDQGKIGYNAPAHIGLVGGAGAVAKQLLEAVRKRSGPIQNDAWIAEARKASEKINQPFTSAAVSTISPVHPGRVAAEVAKFILEEAPNWHIVCDGGDAASWMDANARATYPGQVIRYGPLGTIGTGQGFAMGAYMADQNPVLYYTGDGSLGFYTMEFDTYLRHKIPVVCVISNDSAWGMIKLSEENGRNAEYVQKHGHLATVLHPMREYEKLPEMWGGIGIRVDRYEDIIPAIRKVRDSGLPGIVNVSVDQKAMTPATAAFSGGAKK